MMVTAQPVPGAAVLLAGPLLPALARASRNSASRRCDGDERGRAFPGRMVSIAQLLPSACHLDVLPDYPTRRANAPFFSEFQTRLRTTVIGTALTSGARAGGASPTHPRGFAGAHLFSFVHPSRWLPSRRAGWAVQGLQVQRRQRRTCQECGSVSNAPLRPGRSHTGRNQSIFASNGGEMAGGVESTLSRIGRLSPTGSRATTRSADLGLWGKPSRVSARPRHQPIHEPRDDIAQRLPIIVAHATSKSCHAALSARTRRRDREATNRAASSANQRMEEAFACSSRNA